jgi:flagellar biosynthesis/type III secretory pathway M-ring protein FliF/YscJ
VIKVPKEYVYQQRIKVASQGIPGNSKVGFELFDQQQFGATDFEQKIKYLRALEGELSTTIEALVPIEKAKVHIAFPKETVFVAKQIPPSASVIVKLVPNMILTPKQIRGIKNLTSAAVAKLTAENVKVVKENGDPLGEHDERDKDVTGRIRSKKVVLVAEDSSVSREIIDAFLSKTGVKYEIEDNGAKLLRRLSEVGVDNVGLIITDIEMPEKDGFQVVTTIRDTPEWRHLPIVINSSMTSASIVAKMASVGADEFVGKTDVKMLYELVKKYMVDEKDHRDNINPSM